MINKNNQIQNLRKVTISIRVIDSVPNTELESQFDLQVSFIFGIGSVGLTPFEYELAKRNEGDIFVYSTEGLGPEMAFGHIAIWFMPHLKVLRAKKLLIRVDRVEEANQREIIKALAEVAQCGDDCCNC